MELKVWVEGIQRIVCGVTVNTTCQDVVFALAHATGKVGRFTLIERWRNNERLLAPNENPLKLLLKWGEYANDVQFILQRSESKQQQQQQLQQQHMKQETQQQHNTTNNNNNSNNNNINNTNNNNNESTTVMLNKKPLGLSNINNHNNNNNNNNNSNLTKQINNNNNNNNNNSNSSSNTIDNALNANTTTTSTITTQQHQKPLTMELSLNAAHERAKELKKSFGVVHEAKYSENIGIVKGIPQRNNNSNSNNLAAAATTKTTNPTASLIPRHEKSHSNPIEMPSSASSAGGLGNFEAGNTIFKGNGAYQEHNNHSTNNNNNNNNHNNTNNIYQQLGAHNSKSINEINLAEVRNALDRRTMLTTTTTNTNAAATQNSSSMGGSAEIIFTNTNQSLQASNSNQSNENLLDIFNGNATTTTNGSNAKFSPNSPNDLYKQATTISANGALVPPPYRDPPPPRNSPLQQQLNGAPTAQLPNSNFSSQSVSPQHPANALYSNQPILPSTQQQQQQSDYADYADYQQINDLVLPTNMDESESIFQATQYNDLLQLIKFQREKINQQQMELTKYDAEIVYLESKERDQAQELEAISREITKADQLFRQGSEQLQTLQYVEEENELVKQQEKTLKSEIALLRSKLANCETELLQCKNKIRLLMDDIEIEQRAITSSKQNIRQNVERDFLMEMERIQGEIDQAIHNTDSSNKTAESLKKEILLIETAIAEKKRQVEQLVNEMKEVNLQSLTVTTSEEIKHLLEGSNKPGSSRRIIGSPRQLENAVPTSKNPHGVWV
ncbi:bromodomain-containing protein DDB_G0280777 [Calliphora vicina]|uniref:bromodomain-containing protein DDB_G0280777 n=1 Tax=Calliphora vicina TaxID=7373 RepID=UPI00325C0684